VTLPKNVILRDGQFEAWIQLFIFDEIAVGVQSILRHLLHFKPITIQYPHEKRLLPENYRGMLALLQYDDGTEKCVGCDRCEATRPSRVISVVSAEVSEEPIKERNASNFNTPTWRIVLLCFLANPLRKSNPIGSGS
jgi:formate hydrogenlyase subunit 6/NADH:ubiquinone oxidoreductase subunit I